MNAKYPDITAHLVGHDGNAFSVLGIVAAALKAGGIGSAQIAEFNAQATAGDYDDLLRTCHEWVEVT